MTCMMYSLSQYHRGTATEQLTAQHGIYDKRHPQLYHVNNGAWKTRLLRIGELDAINELTSNPVSHCTGPTSLLTPM
jgi:hypothetical protein